MVWSLVPAEGLRGAQKYYIFASGRYKVGRKDCDIVVQMDTAVSRLHAEVIVDKMVSHDLCFLGQKTPNSHVKIKDYSKYGTFVNKELGPMSTRLRHSEEVKLKEGDTVTFGTGNATFRFCYVPFIIFIHSSVHGRIRPSFQDFASYIGAEVTSKWSPKITHVLVDESSSVTMEIIESVLAKKIVVLADWFKVLAEKNICLELPSPMHYLPSLNLEGNLVKIVEPQVRENCLEGYTFVLVSNHKYKFGSKLLLLLEASGATHVSVDELSDSQTGNNHAVLVIPEKTTSEYNHSRQLSNLSRITEINLVAAVLSGRLDSSTLELVSYDPNKDAVVITSSQSTDETIVADSDVEIDAATSTGVITTIKAEITGKNNIGGSSEKVRDKESINDYDEQKEVNYEALQETKASALGEANVVRICKLDEANVAHMDEFEHSDIIYNSDLIVRDTTAAPSMSSEMAANFKCFRKRETVSGNNFRDLIPFSKDPYKENDHGRESDYMKDERKRKQLEAIAEELFNNVKLRKRTAAGTSLEAFLSHR
ncbi:hypothetical protein HPP92_015158 [Vanilla planifolia]|uniref:Nijmegen breakage syndrome 1 protein n=1 Tax=Vanilla planifolia TaxID=51239 RepID=A0A835QHC5_VANPL|nr:hypothetical protein HPP92_015158 [Vanilla planifolia]